jgi:hypothetical protein
MEDGVLADVTPQAEGLFTIPVAVTSALWGILEDLPADQRNAGAVNTRIREVLRAANDAAHGCPRPTSQFTFPVLLGTTSGLRNLELLVHCGPGDFGEPVITIGFPIDF